MPSPVVAAASPPVGAMATRFSGGGGVVSAAPPLSAAPFVDADCHAVVGWNSADFPDWPSDVSTARPLALLAVCPPPLSDWSR